MNNLPKLSKKVLTKLLDADFRKSILNTYVNDEYKLFSYAKYVVDSTIISRDKTHEKDKAYNYGFSPLGIVCAVLEDGTIEKRFLEFNTVNYFLRDFKGVFAIEVVKCILILWLNENEKIQSFDYMKIDAELARVEKEYLDAERKAAEAKKLQTKQEAEQLSAIEQLSGVKSPNVGPLGVSAC